MNGRIVRWIPIVLAMAAAAPLSAQTSIPPISVDLRGGLSLPVGDFGRQRTLGYGLGGDVIVGVTQSLSAYGGYRYVSFDFDKDVVGPEEGSDNVQGFDAGLRFGAPSLRSAISPYLRLGGVYYKEAISGLGAGAKHRLGYQLGGGFDYALGPRASLTPELSYTTVSYQDRVNMSFVTLDFGLRLHM